MAGVDTSVSVKWVNLRPTIKRLEELGVDVQDLKDAFGDIANRVTLTAKDVAPVSTDKRSSGKLRESIRGSRRKNGAVITTRSPMPGRPYHRYVYYGITPGKKVAPRPYLNIAAEQNRYWIRDQVVRGVNEAIRKAGL